MNNMEEDLSTEDTELFIELKKSIDKNKYEKAIEFCNKIRAKSPHDLVAVKCKCQCLMHLGQMEKALELAKQPRYQEHLLFERAYCQYHFGQFQEALGTCLEGENVQASSSTDDPAEGLLHLQAQILYKLGEYDRAVSCYQTLLEKNPDPELSPELYANAYAAHTAAQRASELLELHPISEFERIGGRGTDSDHHVHDYELLYNAGGALAQAGRFEEAKELLLRAEEACQALVVSGDLTEEEAKSENEVVQAELAFVQAHLGDTEAALRACKTIFQNKSADPQLIAVASNNYAVLSKDINIKDALKRIGVGLPEGAESKLFPSQLEQLRLNRCLLRMSGSVVQQSEHLPAEIEAFEVACPTSERPALLKAAIALKARKMDSYQAHIEEALEKVKGTPREVAVVFFKAQVQIHRKDFAGALATLESIQDPNVVHSPGLIGAKAALYIELGQGRQASNVLEDVVGRIDELAISGAEKATLVLGVAKYRLCRGLHQEAASALEALLTSSVGADLDPDARLNALASLVKAYSWVDLDQAEMKAGMLPPLPEVDEDICDANQLEIAEVPRMRHLIAAGAIPQIDRKRKNLRKILKKRAKKRIAYLERLQAEGKYDPNRNIKPDPERWIPRKQRSFGRRGRRRNKFVGAQGAGDGGKKDAAKLDAFARAQAKKEREEQEEPKVQIPSGVGRKKGGRRR